MSKATLHYSRPRLPRRLARQQHPGLKSKLELTAVCDDNSHHYYQLSFCLSEQRFVGLEIILKNYFYVSMNGWVKCFGWGGVQEWQIFSIGLVYWEFSSCFWAIFLIVPFCSRPVAVRTGPAPVRGPTIFSAAIICNNWARAAALLGPASTPHLPGFFPGLCLVHRGSLRGHSSIPDNPFSLKKGVSKGSSTKPIWKQDNFSGIILCLLVDNPNPSRKSHPEAECRPIIAVRVLGLGSGNWGADRNFAPRKYSAQSKQGSGHYNVTPGPGRQLGPGKWCQPAAPVFSLSVLLGIMEYGIFSCIRN